MSLIPFLGGDTSTTATANTQPTAANNAPALGGFIRGNGAESVGGPSVVLTNLHTGAATAKPTATAAGGAGSKGKGGKAAAQTAPATANSSINVTTYSQNLDPSVVTAALSFAENFGEQATALSALAIQQSGAQAATAQYYAAQQAGNTQLISAQAITAAQQQSASISQAATTNPNNNTELNPSGPQVTAASTSLSIEKIGLIVTVAWFLYVVAGKD